MTEAAAASGPDRARVPFADANPVQVRAALIPEEAREFEEQWRTALAEAADSLDLVPVLELLASWRRVAWATAVAGHDEHRRLYRRAAAHLSGVDVPDSETLAQTKALLGL